MTWQEALEQWRARLPGWLRWAAAFLAALALGALATAAILRLLTPRVPVPDPAPTVQPHLDRATEAAAQATQADARADALIAAYATEAQAVEADHATVDDAGTIADVVAVLYGASSRAPGPPPG